MSDNPRSIHGVVYRMVNRGQPGAWFPWAGKFGSAFGIVLFVRVRAKVGGVAEGQWNGEVGGYAGRHRATCSSCWRAQRGAGERARGQDKGLPLGTARADPPRVLFVLWMALTAGCGGNWLVVEGWEHAGLATAPSRRVTLEVTLPRVTPTRERMVLIFSGLGLKIARFESNAIHSVDSEALVFHLPQTLAAGPYSSSY